MFIQQEDKTVPDDINNFQIFMTVIGEKEMADKKKDVKDVLSLILPDYTVLITPRSLVFQDSEKQSL